MSHDNHTLDSSNLDLNLQYPDKESYLKLVKDWKDPNPKPVIEKIQLPDKHVYVVRDDLLEYGSKMRFSDLFVRSRPEKLITYAQPRFGYAGITLSYLGKKYGKEVVLHYPEYKGPLTDHLTKCKDLGATLIPKRIYGMNGLRKASREYAENNDGYYVPPGLRGIPEITACAVKVASNIDLPKDVSEVWTVISTGQLHRALKIAWPDLPFRGVAMARNLKPGETGHTNIYSHPFPYNKPESREHLPPFPSAITYDAKAWRFIKEHAKPGALFWNVA